ncbi:MAG: leucyl/phenylalanyl-tRNA--protein transferase [Planctomycetia bacterium]|nr:leucyl/phenylalanyl-tRNA--protein transferase [Planctomycetia bacterium]
MPSHTNIRFLLEHSLFPPTATADSDGFLGVGGDLSVRMLLDAYIHGIFPWPCEDSSPEIPWWAPHERAIIEFENFHISRRLRQTLRSGKFDVSIDRNFRGVVEGCAYAFRPDEGGTWITPQMIKAYCALHHAGFAHSIEVWRENRLVGGLYGVGIGAFFAGESKFHRETDASKVALAWIVRHLQARGYDFIDVQFENDHLKQFHLTFLPQSEYNERVRNAVLKRDVSFGHTLAWRKEDF